MACCVLFAALIAGILCALRLLGKHDSNSAHRWQLPVKDPHEKR